MIYIIIKFNEVIIDEILDIEDNKEINNFNLYLILDKINFLIVMIWINSNDGNNNQNLILFIHRNAKSMLNHC